MLHCNDTERTHELWATGIMRIVRRNAELALLPPAARRAALPLLLGEPFWPGVSAGVGTRGEVQP